MINELQEYYNMGGMRFMYLSAKRDSVSKLDRILVSRHSYSRWPNASLMVLPREVSNHCPLVLKVIRKDFGRLH